MPTHPTSGHMGKKKKNTIKDHTATRNHEGCQTYGSYTIDQKQQDGSITILCRSKNVISTKEVSEQ